jgi:hypothetical protein
MGNRKETPFFWDGFLAAQPAPPLAAQPARRPSRGPTAQLGSPLPRLGLARWPSCGLPRAPRGLAASPLRAPRHPRAVGAATALPCGPTRQPPQNCPLPLPSLTPRVHNPLLPTSHDRPCPISASPAAAAVRPSAVSPGPPSLSLLCPLLPSAWCRLGARCRALGARPWWPWCPAPRGSRRGRSPAPACGGPDPPVPAAASPPPAMAAQPRPARSPPPAMAARPSRRSARARPRPGLPCNTPGVTVTKT